MGGGIEVTKFTYPLSMGCILRTYFRGGLVSIANEVGALEGTTSTSDHAYGLSNRAPAKHVALWEEEQSRSSSICSANSNDKRIATSERSYEGIATNANE